MSRADSLFNPFERKRTQRALNPDSFPLNYYLSGCRSTGSRKGSWRDWSRRAAKVWRGCSARTPCARRSYACAGGRSASRGRCRRIEASRRRPRQTAITLDPRDGDGCSSTLRTVSRARSSLSRCTARASHTLRARFNKIRFTRFTITEPSSHRFHVFELVEGFT